jgi:hypothetical protein
MPWVIRFCNFSNILSIVHSAGFVNRNSLAFRDSSICMDSSASRLDETKVVSGGGR